MAENTGAKNGEQPRNGQSQSISMHDGIPVWYDCCSCEAEPYWAEAMQHQETVEAGKDQPRSNP